MPSGIPARGEVWAEPSLLARLGAAVGDELEVGRLRLRVAQTLEFRPDEGWRFMEIAPTVLLNYDDVLASGLLAPGSIVEYVGLYAGDAAGASRRFAKSSTPLLRPQDELEDFRDGRPEVRRGRGQRGAIPRARCARERAARRRGRGDGRAAFRRAAARCRRADEMPRRSASRGAALERAAAPDARRRRGRARLRDRLRRAVRPHGVARRFHRGAAAAARACKAPCSGRSRRLAVAIGCALPPLLQLGGVPPARVLRNDVGPPPLRYTTIYGVAAAAVTALLYVLFGDFELIAYLLGGAVATFFVLYFAGRLLVLALQRLARRRRRRVALRHRQRRAPRPREQRPSRRVRHRSHGAAAA